MGQQPEDIQSLDRELMRLQKSTRTTVPALLPLHDIMRQRYRWYYNWHLWAAAKYFHTLFLIVFLLGIGGIFYNFLLGQPGRVLAATIFLYPNSDVTTEWNVTNVPPDTLHYQAINEVTLDTADYISHVGETYTDAFDMTTETFTGTITQVTIIAYCRLPTSLPANPLVTASVYMGGVWQTGATLPCPQSPDPADLVSVSFDGTWNQTDLNNLQIRFVKTGTGGATIWRAYARATYFPPPTAVTVTPTPIAAQAMTFQGNITSDNGLGITEKGFHYRTGSACVPTPTIQPVDPPAIGTFFYEKTGLSVNTQYSYRAYATNGAYGFGDCISRYTLTNTPDAAPTVANPQLTTLDVTVNDTQPGNNPAITTYAVGIDQNSDGTIDTNGWVQASYALGASGTALWQTKANWGTKTVTGLASGTTYNFRVMSRNFDLAQQTTLSAIGSGTTLGGGISISGNIYQSGSESTLDTTGYTVAISVNNGAAVTTTAAAGAYTKTGVTASAGQQIAVYIQGVANDANTFTVTDGTTAIENLHLYVNKIAVGNNNGTGTTTNANICAQATYPAAADKLFSCATNNLTITDNKELHILNGEKYDTGASATLTTTNATSGYLHIDTGATATITTTNSSVAGVLITGTLTLANSINLNNTGAWSNNGTFNSGTGTTVTFNGSVGQATGGSAASSFVNVTVTNTNASGIAPATNMNVSGTLTLNANTFFIPGSGVVINSAAAAGTITGSGTVRVTRTAATADYANQYKFTTNTLTNLTVEYYGAGAQSVTSTVTYGGLKINMQGAYTATAAGNLTIGLDLNVAAGTLALSTYTANRSSAGGTLTLGASTTLNIAGTGTLPSNFSTHSINASSTVNYAGTTQSVATLNSSQNYGNLTISGSGTKTLAGNVTVAGNLNVSAGTLATSTYTVNRSVAGGTLTVSNGATLSIGGTNTIPSNYSTHSIGATSTINYSGTTQSITVLNSAQNYGNLTISGSSTKTPAANITVAGDLNVSAGTLDLTTYTANRGTAGGTLTLGSGASLLVGGAFPSNYSTHSINAASTINYDGTTQTVATLNSAQNYGNLTISGSATKTLAGIIGVAGDLNVSAGTLDLSTYTANRSAAGGTLTVANGAGLKIGGTGTLPSNFSAHSIGATSTIEYAGTITTVAALNSSQNYGNLTISGSGVTTTASFSVAGQLTVNGGASLIPTAGLITMVSNGWKIVNNGTLTFYDLTAAQTPNNQSGASYSVGHTLTKTGVFAPTGGTITMGGVAGSSIVKTDGTTFTFQGLTIKDGATVATSATFSIAAALTVGTGSTFTASGGTITMTTAGWGITNNGTLSFKGLTIAGTASSQPNTNFSVAGTLTVSPTVDFHPAGGTITMTSTGWGLVNNGTMQFANLIIAETPSVSGQPNVSFIMNGNLTVNAGKVFTPTGGSITWGSNGNINNNSGTLSFKVITINEGVTVGGSTDFTVDTSFTNAGTYSPSGGTVTLSTTGWQIVNSGNLNFNGLTISETTSNQPSDSFSVGSNGGALTVNANKNLSPSGGTITMTGGSISNSGTLTFNNITFTGTTTSTSSFSVAGTLNVSGGNFSPTASSTVTMNNSSQITNTGTLAFYNLTLPSSATVTANNGFSVITGGTLSVGGSAIFSPAATAVISGAGTLNGTGTVYVSRTAATADFSSQYTISNQTLTNLTVSYRGASAQTVSATTYGNLDINMAGQTATLGAEATCSNFTITAGTFNGGSANLNVTGTWSKSGTFTANAGTVTFNGSGAQQINASNTFNNLTITTTAARTISFASDTTQTVADTWNVTGLAADKRITLNPTGANNWTINPAVANVTYANVSKSNSGLKLCATYSTDGTGNNSNWYFSDTNSCAPPQITNLSATPTGTNKIQWNFTNSGSNTTSIRLYNPGGEQQFECVDPPFTSCEETGLSTNAVYTRKIKAVNGWSEGDTFSDQLGIYTLAAQPGDPTSITAQSWSAGSGNSINVTLAANGNPDGTEFEIYYDTDPEGTFVTTAQTFTAHNNGDVVSHSSLTADITYYYKVKAQNHNGVTTAYNPAATPPSAMTAPAQPTNTGKVHGPSNVVGHTDNSTTSITWAWNGNATAPTGYKVYVDDGSSCTSTEKASVLDPNTTATESTGFTADTSYRRCIKGYRGSITGQPTAAFSAFTSADAPTGASHNNTGQTTTAIPWAWASGGAQHNFYASDDIGNNSGTIPGTSWTDNVGMSANSRYQLNAHALNGDSDSTVDTGVFAYTSIQDPTGITATADSTSQISLVASGTLSNLNAGSSGLQFGEIQGNPGSGGQACFTGWTQTNSCADTGLSANTLYRYNATARNGDGEPSATYSFQQRYTLIESPTTITTGLITPNSIVLNVPGTYTNLNAELPDPSGLCFSVLQGADKGGGGGTGFTSCAKITTITDVGLTHGSNFSYKVFAQNSEAVPTPTTAEIGPFLTTIGSELIYRLPGQNAYNQGSNISGTSTHRKSGEAFNVEMYAVDNNYYQDADEDHLVDITTTAPSSSITDPTLVDGAITFSATINSAGTFTLTGTGSAGSSGEFVVDPGICSATVSTVSASPTSLDVEQTSTITIYIKDAAGNPLAGHAVSVSSNQAVGADTIVINAAATDANGRITATLTGHSAHTSTITVTDTTDAVTLSTKPQITFNAVSPNNPTNVSANATVSACAGTPPTCTVKIDLSWTNPPSFGQINIYRSETLGEKGSKITDTAGDSYTDNDVSPGVRYFYTLEAEDDVGNKSSGTAQVSARGECSCGDTEAPTAPSNLRATRIRDTSFSIAWDASRDNVGVTGYQVYNAETGIMVGVTTETNYDFDNLQPDTVYKLYVRAYDAANNFSAFSEVLTVRTLKGREIPPEEREIHLILSNVPEQISAGTPFSGKVRVTAADAGGRILTDYQRAIYFSSTDANAKLPYIKDSPYTYTSLDGGIHQFNGQDFALKTTGNQKLIVSDYSVSSSANIKVIAGVFVNQTAEKIRDFISKPETVNKANTVVVTTTAAILLAPVVANAIISFSSLLPQIFYWLTQLLQLLGIKKRAKPWGVIFNAETGQPLSLAMVRIYETKYNRILERVVTDNQGRYGFLVKPGEFYITCSKTGFIFPSKEKKSTFYEKIYTGGHFKIADKDQTVAFNIPLDPASSSKSIVNLWIWVTRINKLLQKLRLPLLILGIVFALIMMIIAFNFLYVLSLGFYVLIGILEILRSRKARPYGVVTDNYNHPMSLSIVRIYKKNNNQLIETDVSDNQGRFKFLVAPGVYYITATKPGYIDFKSHLMYLEKEKTLVSTTIKLKKIEKQIRKIRSTKH